MLLICSDLKWNSEFIGPLEQTTTIDKVQGKKNIHIIFRY